MHNTLRKIHGFKVHSNIGIALTLSCCCYWPDTFRRIINMHRSVKLQSFVVIKQQLHKEVVVSDVHNINSSV